MVNQELLNCIKNSKNASLSDEEIRKNLLSTGWTNQDIDEAFKSITPPIVNVVPDMVYSNSPAINPSTVSSTTIGSSLIDVEPFFVKKGVILGVIGIILSLILFAYLFISNNTNLFPSVMFLTATIIQFFTLVFSAFLLRVPQRNFLKSFIIIGESSIFFSVYYFLYYFVMINSYLTSFLSLIIIIINIYLIIKIYKTSVIKGFGVWLLMGLLSAFILIILTFSFGLGYLFSTSTEVPSNTNNTIEPENLPDSFSSNSESILEMSNSNSNQPDLNVSVADNDGLIYNNATYSFSFKYPSDWKVEKISEDDIVTIIPKVLSFNEIPIINIYSSGFNMEDTENSLINDNIVYTKEIISLNGISWTKFVYNKVSKIDTRTRNLKAVILYIPEKGKGKGYLSIVGSCTTFSTVNAGNPCSNAINNIMDVVISTLKFK